MCTAAFGNLFSGASGAAGGSFLGGAAQLAPSLIGAVGKAGSAANIASAQRSLAQYHQNNALTNASLAEQQAADTVQQGELQASQLSQKARQLKGSQRAALAASGVRLDTGSPANILASTDYMRDVDLATIRNNAARAAWGQRATATNYRNQAGAFRADASAQSPMLSGVTSLLGSASGISEKWYNMYKNGGLDSSRDTSFDSPSAYG